MIYSEGLKLLKSYQFPRQLEDLLKHQLNSEVNGLCLALVGNRGTNKRSIVEKIADFLERLGKINSSTVRYLTLGERNIHFDERAIYSLVNIKSGIQRKDFIARSTHVSDKNPSVTSKGIQTKEESTGKGHDAIEILLSQYRGKYIIVNDSEDAFRLLIEQDASLRYVFSDVIRFRDLADIEISEIVVNNLHSVDSLNKIKLIQYIKEFRGEIPFENRELALYIANYMNSHKNQLPPGAERPDSSQSLLSEIVGLAPVKQQIDDFKQYLIFKRAAEAEGLALPKQALHMLFLGDAGTGKTTVARIIAQILYEIGMCKENKLIEVSRKDLIAEYVGQTAPKTQAVIEKAMNGVLFIDEAYALTGNTTKGDSFGEEAIATLIKAMEDNKDKLIVIFAGYTNEMTKFVNANSGISSRIGYTFHFPNYSEYELLQIYLKKMSKFSLTDEAVAVIKPVISYFHDMKNVGNGRLIDKLVQHTLIKHSKTFTSVTNISAEDIPTIKEVSETIWTDGIRTILPESITPKDFKATAYHEVGHALLRFLGNEDSGITKITIVPEATGTLGYVQYKDEKPLIHVTKNDREQRIRELLAGRAAEQHFLGIKNVSSGCSSDIQKASEILVRNADVGFSDTFGLLAASSVFSKEKIAEMMKPEIIKDLDRLYKETLDIIKEHSRAVAAVSKQLLKKQTMTGDEINDSFKKQLKK